jgi:anthranilate synthase component I
MKKISIHTKSSSFLADVHTPVSIYLRLRDRFRDTILLESTDSHVSENSFSFICINAVGGIEITDKNTAEQKYPGQDAEKISPAARKVDELLWSYMQGYECTGDDSTTTRFAQGLYGYFTYDAVQLFEHISFNAVAGAERKIPLARYRLYQYVIAINHYFDELVLLENCLQGVESEASLILSLIQSKDVPVFPFAAQGKESSNLDDAAFMSMVQQGIQSCKRGDVFQVVLSRSFQQQFSGDEFNVYRALRHINPSPYLFFFDYGDYRLMGSSPEAQLVMQKGEAVVHPIAGTFRRSGNEEEDVSKAEALKADPKENAEHVMLVDLARNDLSTVCSEVEVSRFRQVQFYSHVIHLVSEVKGKIAGGISPFTVLFKTFPAGTLSGAPKYKAMHLIDAYETGARGFYGGALGFVGFNGDCNHAIMIRSMLSKNNTLYYQAGAGVVAASHPESELNEVNNKLNALKAAIKKAETIQ